MNRLLTLLTALAISSWSFGQCVANYTSSQSPAGSQVVNFTNNSTPSGGPNVHFYWDFDDGTFDNSTNPVHTFGSNGTYMVCLTIIDSTAGCSNTFCDSIVVTNASGSACNVTSNVYESNGVIYGSHTSTAATNEWYVFDPNSNLVVNTTNNSFSHTALMNGTYQVYLHGYDAGGQFCDSTWTNITISGVSSNCSAVFAAYPDSTSSTVWFDGSSSTGGTAVGLNYSWDFGDGSTGTGMNPSHNYASAGTYTVCLVIDDGAGCVDSTCSTVTVASGGGSGTTPCMANFWSVDSLNTLYFINTSNGSALNYFWDFGDGSTSSLTHPNHTYSAAGVYTVCLTVWNSTCSDTICYPVTVNSPTGGPTCSAGFVWFVDSAFSTGSTNTVYIFNTATGNNLTYSWDFGDGNTSNQAYPTHQYQQNGTYMICLTIDDGAGCTDTYCDTVSYTQRQEGFTINILPLGSNDELSVEETGLEFNKLYPNPANDNITVDINNINGEDVSLTITDMTGRTIYSNNLVGSTGNQSHNINISDLSSGMYNLTIKSENTQIVKRFIKH